MSAYSPQYSNNQQIAQQQQIQKPIRHFILFYSTKCPECNKFMSYMSQFDALANITKALDIETSTYPSELTHVPGIIENDRLFIGKDAFDWLNHKISLIQQSQQQSQLNTPRDIQRDTFINSNGPPTQNISAANSTISPAENSGQGFSAIHSDNGSGLGSSAFEPLPKNYNPQQGELQKPIDTQRSNNQMVQPMGQPQYQANNSPLPPTQSVSREPVNVNLDQIQAERQTMIPQIPRRQGGGR